jgi:hypothetical protein
MTSVDDDNVRLRFIPDSIDYVQQSSLNLLAATFLSSHNN